MYKSVVESILIFSVIVCYEILGVTEKAKLACIISMVRKIGAKQEPLSNLYLTAVEEKNWWEEWIFFTTHNTISSLFLFCISPTCTWTRQYVFWNSHASYSLCQYIFPLLLCSVSITLISLLQDLHNTCRTVVSPVSLSCLFAKARFDDMLLTVFFCPLRKCSVLTSSKSCMFITN